jgi:hypothetical protein
MTAIPETATEAPPLQPIEPIPSRDSGQWSAIVYWQAQMLAEKCEEICDLLEALAAKDRQIEIYRRLIADFERQKGDGK